MIPGSDPNSTNESAATFGASDGVAPAGPAAGDEESQNETSSSSTEVEQPALRFRNQDGSMTPRSNRPIELDTIAGGSSRTPSIRSGPMSNRGVVSGGGGRGNPEAASTASGGNPAGGSRVRGRGTPEAARDSNPFTNETSSVRTPLTPTPQSENVFLRHSHAVSAATATAEANRSIDELLNEATQTIGVQAARLTVQELDMAALRSRDALMSSRVDDLRIEIDRNAATHDAEVQRLSRLGGLSQSQVSHVASIAMTATSERDEALQEANVARDAAETERQWRLRAQAQVEHVASLAEEYRFQEQAQARIHRAQLDSSVQEVVDSLTAMAIQADEVRGGQYASLHARTEQNVAEFRNRATVALHHEMQCVANARATSEELMEQLRLAHDQHQRVTSHWHASRHTEASYFAVVQQSGNTIRHELHQAESQLREAR